MDGVSNWLSHDGMFTGAARSHCRTPLGYCFESCLRTAGIETRYLELGLLYLVRSFARIWIGRSASSGG